MAKPSRPQLTARQLQALKNLAAGKPSWDGLFVRHGLGTARGGALMGGHQQTMASLRRKLFVDGEAITPEGLRALEALK